jgi:O-antigen/teichoic acid export membrane protein
VIFLLLFDKARVRRFAQHIFKCHHKLTRLNKYNYSIPHSNLMPDVEVVKKSILGSPFDTEHLKNDLKARSVRGGAATMLGQGTLFVIQTASTIVMARLLTPADFGLIAMVTAITGFANLFKDLGLSLATVQRAEITYEQISTLFWVNVAVSVMIALAMAALAPFIARFYGEPRVTLITITLSLVFLFGGLTVQHQALLQRQMRFTTLAAIQVVAVSAGVSVAIVSAILGAGYWALVMMQAASALSIALGVWLVCGWRPGQPVRNAGVKSMLVFGGNITGFNVVNYFARNSDNILIGRVWGAGPLGFYSKAYSLLVLPLNQINFPIASVAVPALSRLYGDPAKYNAYYLKTISLITLVSTPLVSFFITCSDKLILLILGSQWAAASDIFRVLGFSALIQPLYNTQGWLHISAGRSDRYLRWGLIGSFVIVLGFVAGLQYGPLGVAVAYTVATWAITFPCMWYAGRSAGIRASDIFGAVGKNIAAGLGSIAISIILLEHILIFKATWVNLLTGLCGVCVTYSAFLLFLYRDLSPWHQVADVVATFIRPIVRKSPVTG